MGHPKIISDYGLRSKSTPSRASANPKPRRQSETERPKVAVAPQRRYTIASKPNPQKADKNPELQTQKSPAKERNKSPAKEPKQSQAKAKPVKIKRSVTFSAALKDFSKSVKEASLNRQTNRHTTAMSEVVHFPSDAVFSSNGAGINFCTLGLGEVIFQMKPKAIRKKTNTGDGITTLFVISGQLTVELSSNDVYAKEDLSTFSTIRINENVAFILKNESTRNVIALCMRD